MYGGANESYQVLLLTVEEQRWVRTTALLLFLDPSRWSSSRAHMGVSEKPDTSVTQL